MATSCRLFVLALSMALAASAVPTGAVIIRDDVWRAYGGSEEDWTAGFGPALELAAEPQFSAVLAIYREDGSQSCTGTWIGNGENGNAFVLTSAHCFNSNPDIGARLYRTDGGTELADVARTLHPQYDPADSDISGYYDLAVVELDGPIEDSGEAPVLYSGSTEHGYVSTQVGYGTRGTGEYGNKDWFKDDFDKAAARNTIDPFKTFLLNDAGDSFLLTILDLPDNPEGKEVDELQGIGAEGDSGGSLWIETEEGWRIVGVYSASTNTEGSSDTNPVYNDAASYFARVSTNLDFITSVFPDALTGE